MRSLPGNEGRFSQWLTTAVNVFLLGCMWLLCSLPVFTIGASTCALNVSMQKVMNHEEQDLLKEYFQRFKEYFRPATPVWLIHLAVGTLALFEFGYYRTDQGVLAGIGTVVMLVLAILAVENAILCLIALPEFPERKVLMVIRQGAEMGASAPFLSFGVFFFSCAVPAAVFLLVPELFPFSFGITSWMDWHLIPDILKKYRVFRGNRRLKEEF
jgi:uncharacterized membrane protein YesL